MELALRLSDTPAVRRLSLVYRGDRKVHLRRSGTDEQDKACRSSRRSSQPLGNSRF
jgi:hypothetical protein